MVFHGVPCVLTLIVFSFFVFFSVERLGPQAKPGAVTALNVSSAIPTGDGGVFSVVVPLYVQECPTGTILHAPTSTCTPCASGACLNAWRSICCRSMCMCTWRHRLTVQCVSFPPHNRLCVDEQH